MGTARKRPKLYIGTLPNGSEYYYFLKPTTLPAPATPRATKKKTSAKATTTVKKSKLTKARERKVKLG